MSKRFFQFFIPVILGLGWLQPAAAQASELKYDHRVAGDRALTIQLGGVWPEAFQKFDGSLSATNLTLGGTMGLDVDVYLNDAFRLGGGLKGKATSSPNAFTLFMVPLTFRAVWEPKVNYFSFPVGLGAGFCLTNFRSDTSFDPVLIPTAGVYYNVSSSWSFGIEASQWIVFQLYYSKPSDHRIGHFADLTLGAIYHF